VVAKNRGWRLKSLTLTGCPLSAAPRNLPEPAKSECAKWNQDVLAWFQAHPEVSTVFVSELAGGTGAVVPSGQSKYKTEVAGYVNAWNALPPTVKHIVVIRDTPKQMDSHAGLRRERRSARRRTPASSARSRARRRWTATPPWTPRPRSGRSARRSRT
jgi:hypothetical protein